MTDMLWIVPSRSRPSNIADLIATMHRTRCMADLLVVIDNDDPELEEYRRVLLGFQGFSWLSFVESDRRGLVGSLNWFASVMAPKYDIIGFMGDDHRPKSPIWDGLMAAQLRQMKTGIVYGNDLHQRENLPTAVAMTTDIISTLGYMAPPTLQHLYVDNFWLDLGHEVDRIEYMEHVIIEHLHPHAGKSETDEQYERLNSGEQNNRDKQAFLTYKRKGFAADVEKIKAVLR